MVNRFLSGIALLLLAFTPPSWAAPKQQSSATITTSGGTATLNDPVGSATITLEEVISGTPSAMSIVTQGCMRGGTCATLDTNTATSSAIRSFVGGYDHYVVTATWTGSSITVQLNMTGISAKLGGSGGGSLILTTTGSSGASTYNSGTGALNIPIYSASAPLTSNLIAGNGSGGFADSGQPLSHLALNTVANFFSSGTGTNTFSGTGTGGNVPVTIQSNSGSNTLFPLVNTSTGGPWRWDMLVEGNFAGSAGGYYCVLYETGGISPWCLDPSTTNQHSQNGWVLGWTAGNSTATNDTGISRHSAGYLRVGNGANDNASGTIEAATLKGNLAAIYLPAMAWSLQPGTGDGGSAITAATYTLVEYYNDSGKTITFSGFRCYTNNNGTSTLDVQNGAGTSFLTGPITCTNTAAAGTQSGTTTLAAGDILKFIFTADGTTTQAIWPVIGTRPY